MVMMLKIKHINVSQKLLDFFPYASFIIGIFLFEILTYNKFLGLSSFKDNFLTFYETNWNDTLYSVTDPEGNIAHLGQVLYTTYILPFLEAGFILFLAMVGAIVIALDPENKHKIVLKKQQDPINQMVRDSESAIYFSLPNTANYKKQINQLHKINYLTLWRAHLLNNQISTIKLTSK